MGTITTLRKAVRRALQSNRELSAADFRARRSRDGYEDLEVIRFRVERAKLHRDDVGYLTTGSPAFLALLAAAAMVVPARVVDFGGGFGHYGRMLKAALPTDAFGTYQVAELQSFIEVAQASGFDGFVLNARDVRANVVFSSGTLQYLPDPLAMLAELLALNADYVVLTRNFFSANEPRYFEQRAALFEHGDGPVPQGFTNRQTPLHPQALPINEVLGLINQCYEIIVNTDNHSGVAYDADGLFGKDLICRRR